MKTQVQRDNLLECCCVTEPSVAVLLAFEILQTLARLDLELLKSVQGEERTDESFFLNPIEFKV